MKLLTNTKIKMNKTSHEGGPITEQCQPHKLVVPSDNLCLLANGYLWWFPIQISEKHNVWKMRDKDLLVCEERQPPNGDKFCCLDFWPHIAQPFFGLRSETSLEASKKVFFHCCWGHITQIRVIHWIFGTLHFGTLMSNIMTLNHLVRSFNPQETRFCRNTFFLLLPASHSPSFPFFVLARKLLRLKRKGFSGWSSCVTW